MADPVVIAKQVLAADAAPGATLSLAPDMPPVNTDTPVAEARRHYMRLAALIHPDKLKGTFEKATEAFQLLVRAFETFADPVARKKAFAVAARTAKPARRAPKAGNAVPAKKKARPEKIGKVTLAKTKAKKKKGAKKAASDSEDEDEQVSSGDDDEEEESASSEEDEEEEAEFHFSDDDEEPVVSNSRTPLGQPRTGDDYVMTVVGCPNCRSRWEPDTRQQYSLFMGKWGKKVHCQLCLLVFGSASALHNCPHCQATFDYDASMYDSVIDCRRCKHRIGFPYYPVNQHLIDQVRLDEWRARKEAERAQARERRHRGHRDDADPEAAAEEQLQMWIGSCVVNEECPLCHARVRRQQRQHVEECVKKQRSGPTVSAAAVSLPAAAEKPATRKRAAAPRKAPTAASKPKTALSAKKSSAVKPSSVSSKATGIKKAKASTVKAAKRRRGTSSDDDEDSFSDADEDDESSGTESSFNEDDDDDDFSSDDE